MYKLNKKRTISIILAIILAMGLTACNDKPDASATSANEKNEDVIETTKGGDIALGTGLAAPETAGTMTTLIENDKMTGSYLLINYRTTDYFTTTGSLTLNVNASLFALKDETYQPKETQYQEASVALWKKGEGEAEFIKTAYFKADGTTYTASFTDLDPTAQYRVAFTYSDVVKYRMTGTFSLSGVSSAGEEQKDNAASKAASAKGKK
ncbi:MAG: hypothetical protein RR573_03115 [Oscillospiraceae bacterium]